MRTATANRDTKETKVQVELNLDGRGEFTIHTGIGFFDHMLAQVARHGLIDLAVTVSGDLEVDPHHTVEDAGLVLGQALKAALGDRTGITRYGDALLPMDEALAMVAIDLGGRPFLRYQADLGKNKVGAFDDELIPEFLQAIAVQAGMNIHIRLLDGSNLHHCIEAIFKAFGRALSQAIRVDDRIRTVPSTKGTLI